MPTACLMAFTGLLPAADAPATSAMAILLILVCACLGVAAMQVRRPPLKAAVARLHGYLRLNGREGTQQAIVREGLGSLIMGARLSAPVRSPASSSLEATSAESIQPGVESPYGRLVNTPLPDRGAQTASLAGRSEGVQPGSEAPHVLGLPVLASLASAPGPELVAKLTRTYDLDECVEWSRGSEPVLTTASGQFKLHGPRRSASAIGFELQVVNHLRQHGYPAPVVMQTRAAGGYFKHDGSFYFLAKCAADHPYDPNNKKHLRAAAQAMAAFHNVMRGYPGPFRLDASPDLPQAAREGLAALPVLGDLMAASPDTTGRRSIERLFESLESDLKSIGGDLEHAYRSQPRCVIHGSFSPGVLLFEGDNLVSVDGMQSARYDCLLADLAQAITAFCSTKKRGLFSPPALDPDRYRTFLRAYRKEAPLTREQLDVFALVLRIQRLLGVMEESRRFLTATLHGQDSIHLAPTSRNGACSATDAAL